MTQGDLLYDLLARLRRIGWSAWDPIGLAEAPGRPDDEYDTYLLRVASSLVEGRGVDTASRYLVRIERDYMGLGERLDAVARAAATVEAVDDLLSESAASP